jgi:hypothetical protein
MFSWIRRRFNYANVTATLALFFAMTGGALAASHYLITSTKQIKPSVLSALKGKAGPAGAAGANGANGAAGEKGPQGPQGPAGANGTNGTSGSNGESVKVEALGKSSSECNQEGGAKFSTAAGHATACNGKTGFTETLPPGKTETGTWAFYGSFFESNETREALVPISFNIPLKSELGEKNVHFVTKSEWEGGDAPGECSGKPANPTAAPGNLCVYETITGAGTFGAITGSVIINPAVLGGSGAATAGAYIFMFAHYETINPGEEEPHPTYRGFGTWAVTAPEE